MNRHARSLMHFRQERRHFGDWVAGWAGVAICVFIVAFIALGVA